MAVAAAGRDLARRDASDRKLREWGGDGMGAPDGSRTGHRIRRDRSGRPHPRDAERLEWHRDRAPQAGTSVVLSSPVTPGSGTVAASNSAILFWTWHPGSHEHAS